MVRWKKFQKVKKLRYRYIYGVIKCKISLKYSGFIIKKIIETIDYHKCITYQRSWVNNIK